MFDSVLGNVYRGCVAYGDQDTGFEMRPIVSSGQTGAMLNLVNNLSVNNLTYGYTISGDSSFKSYVRNCLGAFNTNSDIGNVQATGNNWANDGNNVASALSGDPNLTVSIPALNFAFDTNASVLVKWQFIESQIRSAFTPKQGSGLIDSGTIVRGYHCQYADDDAINPMPLDAAGRHWTGIAPDIGAFEYAAAQAIITGPIRFQMSGNVVWK